MQKMRNEKGVLLRKLSKQIEIGKSTFESIKNGEVHQIISVMEKIVIAFGVKNDDLFESYQKV